MAVTKVEPVFFSDIVEKVKNDEVVLPDFQRGFVWKDKNKQKALIASILTKLPIGSILLLEATGNAFRYKKIGMKSKNIEIEENKQVFALIDGQQRVTVLTAFLTDELISIGEEEEFASPTLRRRFFLKFSHLTDYLHMKDEDLFGVLGFEPSNEIIESLYPKYSTDQIKDKLEYYDKPVNQVLIDTTNCEISKLVNFCLTMQDEAMLLPLYYLYGSSTKKNRNHRNRFKAAMDGIANKYVSESLSILKQVEENKEDALTLAEILYGGKDILAELKMDIGNGSENMKDENSELYLNVSNNLMNRANSWSEYVREYLESCIDNMELYEIKVEGSNIVRAIDIYQNLNLGGKALDVFDLLLARAALNEGSRNLLDTVKDYILADHRDEYKEIYEMFQTDAAFIAYKTFVNEWGEYSASNIMGAIDKDGQLNPTYCNILMSLAGTLYNLADDSGIIVKEKAEKITSQCTKSEELLSIEVTKIENLIKKSLAGLDRACFFLQVKCGIKSISETKYRLLVVILGVIFSQDEWYREKKVHSYLDAWYWAILLSGGFRIEQNKAFQENLRKLVPFFCDLMHAEHKELRPDYIISLCDRTFCDNKYDTEDILLLNNDFIEADASLSDIICQYYLAMTYADILKPGLDEKYKQETISVFSTYGKDAMNLQMHHIMPIGSLDAKYKNVDKLRREDRTCKYNSPLNMIWISDKANRIISNNTLSNYIKYCDTNVLNKIGVSVSLDDSVISMESDKNVESVLQARLVALCSSLKSHYAECLSIQETQINNFYESAKQK